MGASAKEVLTEVGNILLNACLGVFGDLLRVRFTFAVPRLHLETLRSMMDSLVIGDDELRHALLVGARFRVRLPGLLNTAPTGRLSRPESCFAKSTPL